ncbi:lysozyme inhibitor LprI family protein [Fontibacillus sp. BL9]|uniref:lysozyme inhibitor LprI family protein n=1 Tax=Fontibacillus sp. BL9 TaxID=3389971 RepID=UPI003978D32C
MKKLIILTLLTCSFLAGCGNAGNEGANVKQPENSVQEEKQPIKENQPVQHDQPQTEAPATDKDSDNSADSGTSVTGTKEAYLEKLDEIEAGLADLEELNEEGTTASMTEAAAETFNRWDTALNEIYGELKQQLSANEMDDLKEKQREWIKQRDEIAEKEAAEFKGGTMEGLQLVSTKARVTKERCYELVNQYMK